MYLCSDSIVNGIFASLVAAVVFWLLSYKVSGVRIRFPGNLIFGKTSDGKIDKRTIRIKIVNSGWRNMIDVEMYGSISLRDFGEEQHTHTARFGVGITDKVLSIKGECERRKKQMVGAIYQTLYFEKEAYTEYTKEIYSKRIRDLAKQEKLCIWDIMNEYEDKAFLKISILGTDKVTGRRILFESPEYLLKDILFGKYKSPKYDKNYNRNYLRECLIVEEFPQKEETQVVEGV